MQYSILKLLSLILSTQHFNTDVEMKVGKQWVKTST